MAVQVKRSDLVRVAIAQLRADIAQEIRDSLAAEVLAREEFVRAMRAEALHEKYAALEAVCAVCGTTTTRIIADVHLEPTDDVIASPPPYVSVTLRDDELYAARVSLRMKVAAHEPSMGAWIAAVKRRQKAEARGTRAKDLDGDARAKMIDDLLTTLPEGRRVLDELKGFTAAAAALEE